jgi:putative transposase
MIELTREYGRYGYRRIAALLRDAGWHVNDKRVERLWRREGLKVPMKQPKKGRLWLNDGSCVRLRPEHRNHVWSYDFVHCRTDDGKAFRTLNILDEYSRECLAIRVERKLNSGNVIDVLSDLFILRGMPVVHQIRQRPGVRCSGRQGLDQSRWRKDRLHRTRVTLGERILRKLQCPVPRRVAQWRNLLQPARGANPDRRMEETLQHQTTAQCLGYRPPAPETIVQMDQRPIMH